MAITRYCGEIATAELRTGEPPHKPASMITGEIKSTATRARLKIILRGVVQGVGFRPFVYRLATELALVGRVSNSPQGVLVEVEGPRADLEHFSRRLIREKPPRSSIQGCETRWLDAIGFDDFQIAPSETSGAKTTLVPPDIATCRDCLEEIFDATNRRHRYPFTNCTNCGPRFSIINELPYDRANTTMTRFEMCPACLAEYNDPTGRRFHAQPNACPICGPHLECWNRDGEPTCNAGEVLATAAQAIRSGRIVAIKGVGGFQLLVDARNAEAVARLRERKRRGAKPFALMFSSLAGAKAVCRISALEARLLHSPEAPIVLLEKLSIAAPQVVDSVAPHNASLGVMLPYSPLHHLLLADLGFPIVATSANLSDEPICTDEHEALQRLSEIADLFLVHDRPIARPLDDSITRVVLEREMVLRSARGYAPLPLQVPGGGDPAADILAVGAHLKSAVALSLGEQVYLSQHIGDLETELAHANFRRTAADLPRLYDAKPDLIAADLHPDYRSTRYANELAARTDGTSRPAKFGVQHHVAHVLSCIAENHVELPALGVAWDGTGYGPDGTIWGGEFFLVKRDGVRRIAHLRQFRLPGGDVAVVEPRRAALGALHEMLGEEVFEHKELRAVSAFSPTELNLLQTMLRRGVNSPWTSSIGRLFDAVASLTGLCQKSSFEGHAAMHLEFALKATETKAAYSLLTQPHGGNKGQSPMVLDWQPMLEQLLADCGQSVSAGVVAAKFHNALVEAILRVAKQAACPRVALSGGCFQNRYLTERTVTRLRDGGFEPYWHRRVPPNDGGIALGQIYAASRGLKLDV